MTVRTQNEFVKAMKQNSKDKLNAGQKREQLKSFTESLKVVSSKALIEVITLATTQLSKR